MRSCCVFSCDHGYESGDPVSFHRFPFRNKPLLAKWVVAVNKDSNWQPSKWTCICSAHFKETDFIPHQRTPRLRADAFPTIFASTVQSQVRKRLAPDGRYDMQSADAETLFSTDKGSLLGDDHDFSESSVIQTDSGVFLRCSNEESSSNEIFFKSELEEINADVCNPLENLECTEFCEKNDELDLLNLDPPNDNTVQIFPQNNLNEFCANMVFVCDYCNKIFDQKSLLRKHILIHMKKYFCVLCDKIFELQLDLVSHEQEHLSDGKKFVCKICQQDFASFWKLTLHKKTHNSAKKRTHLCKKCRVSLPSKTILNLHMTMHFCENFYTCHDCGKTFSKKIHLKRHLTVHKNQKQYICKFCQKAFAYPSSLSVHEVVHKNSAHSCKYCLRIFPLKSNLIVHELHHEGTTPYKCPFCTISRRGKRSLIDHIRKHLDETPYTCSVCSKQFFNQRRMIIHEKMHTAERPYVCTDCGKAFPTNDTLIPHMQIHSKQKIFICEHCARTFKRKKLFLRHLRVQCKSKKRDGESHQPDIYTCEHCNKNFSNASTLKGHMLHHAPKVSEQNNQFVCNLKSRFKLLLNSFTTKQKSDSETVSTQVEESVTQHCENNDSNVFSYKTCKEEPPDDESLFTSEHVILPEIIKDEPIFFKSEFEDCCIE